MVDARPLLLTNARLFDGTGADAWSGASVLVEDGRIAAVGRDLAARAGSETIDVGGRTLLPGLIDCHVHIAFNGDPDEAPRIGTMPTPVLAWQASENARRTLEAGITTVRDLGTRDNIAIHLRDAFKAGHLPGPRIRAVGAIVWTTGGHRWFIGRQADGPDEVRKAVREQVRAGIDSIEHGIFMDDEALEEMRSRGTFFVPTLAAPLNMSRHGIAGGIPAYAAELLDLLDVTGTVEAGKSADLPTPHGVRPTEVQRGLRGGANGVSVPRACGAYRRKGGSAISGHRPDSWGPGGPITVSRPGRPARRHSVSRGR